jgi:hypothetical protein
MAVLGPDGGAPATVEVFLWPCNVATWQHWQAVQSQWRVGMGGETGLDYAGVRAYLREQGFKRKKRQRLFALLQAAERGHLEGRAERAARERESA